MNSWGRILIEPGNERSVPVGPVQLDVSRGDDAWSYRVLKDTVPTQWRTVFGCDSLELRPALPDLPVMIVPTEPVCVLRGARFRFILPVEPWIQLVAVRAGRPPEVILDIPTSVVHRVWFGSTEQGEPAYLAPLDPFTPGETAEGVHISVHIHNNSPAVLWFEQIAVRANELDVGVRQEELVTNPVSITFKGVEQFSTISVGAFPREKDVVMVTPRRVTAGSDLIRKSFVFLRELTA